MSTNYDRRRDLADADSSRLKLKPIPLVLALIIAALLGYFIGLMAPEGVQLTAGLFGGFMAAVMLGIGASTTSDRVAVMIKTASTLFLVVSLIVSFILAKFCESLSYYVIINGLLLAVYLSAVYGMIKSGAH